jgi:hypothetical protein
VHDDPVGGHADLSGVHESAERSGVDGVVDVGVLQDHQGVLAAQLQHCGLEVLGGLDADDPADAGGAGEVDQAHPRVRDQRGDDISGVGEVVGDHVQDAVGQTEHVGQEQPARDGGVLARFHHYGVAHCQGDGDGADAEDEGGVPRGDRGDDAERHADGDGVGAGRVGGEGLPGGRGDRGCGLAQDLDGETDVERGPRPGGADLAGHDGDGFVGARGQQLGGAQEQFAALEGAHLGPGGERGSRGVHCGGDVSGSGGGHLRVRLAGPRRDVRDGTAAGRGYLLAVDQQAAGGGAHGVSSRLSIREGI